MSPSSHSRLRLVPIVLAQGISFFCGVAGVWLNSHFIPPDVMGFYGVFLTFTPLGMWVVYAGLFKYVSRHWAACSRRDEMVRQVVGVWKRRLPWLAGLVVVAAFMIAPSSPSLAAMVALTLVVSAALLSLGALAQCALQAERSHWSDCAVAASASLSRSFLPPLLYAATGGAAVALLVGFSGHTLVMTLAGAYALRAVIRSKRPVSTSESNMEAVYGGPLFVLVALSGWFLAGLNRWLIAWQFGHTAVGYFTLMGGAATMVTTMLGTVVLQYFQPGLFACGDRPGESRQTLARQTDLGTVIYAALGAAGLIVANAAAPLLIGSLVSPAYRDALVWLLPAGCFGIATYMALFYHTMLLAARLERACGPVDLTTAGVLSAGCVIAAMGGSEWLTRWLLVTPLVPWLLTRPLARHYLFRASPTLAEPSGARSTEQSR